MKAKLFVLFASSLILSVVVNAQVKGVFELVPPATSPATHSLEQVKIVEVFSFGCGHCYHLNKELPALKKRFGNKIKLISNPIGWQGHDPGRLYYIAEERGKGEAVKDMIFDFIHVRGLGGQMYSRDKLRFVAKLNGLTKEFETRMDDPRIVSKMNEAVSYANAKKITGTPTLVIEGVLKASGDVRNLAVIINSLLKKPVK